MGPTSQQANRLVAKHTHWHSDLNMLLQRDAKISYRHQGVLYPQQYKVRLAIDEISWH